MINRRYRACRKILMSEKAPFMHKHVLIIDDDPINNLICEKVLQRAKFSEKITSFLSAIDALDWLQGQAQVATKIPVDVIFLDINLPVLDGWGFLDHLQASALNGAFQIFILSSSVSVDDQKKAAAHPLIHGFILKPLTFNKLPEVKGISI